MNETNKAFSFGEADRQGKFFQSNIEKRQGRRTDGQKNKHTSETKKDREDGTDLQKNKHTSDTDRQTNKQTDIPIR
jgi:hypothetical protein